ncbi:MAG TPA: hypothetical protein VG713_10460 [Pirellulales bacterium]|jgi:hypothetical protein|nr:hypothetical protein [Pirellulales bacterium]
MNRIVATVAVLASVIGVVAAQNGSPRANDVSAFMQLKLDHSKYVLEGIVLEDYPQIAKHAQSLALLSEDAAWQVFQTPEYLRHSNEFRRAAEGLVAAAKDQNIDAATLAYMDTTIKCVNCHKYVRDVRMAE